MVEVTAKQRKELGELGNQYGISFIVVFGSSVKGLTHAKSDLDIGIFFQPSTISGRKSLGEFYFDLLHNLQKIFRDKEVDLVILNRADPLLLKEVSGNCQFLFGSYSDFQEFRIYAFRRYQDYQPYLKLEAEVVTRCLQTV